MANIPKLRGLEAVESGHGWRPARPWGDMADTDEIERLRSERDEWRRRAEVAEAIAAERLARAEAAEQALLAAENAFAAGHPSSLPADVATPSAAPAHAEDSAPRRPASLRERWRRYTDTLN